MQPGHRSGTGCDADGQVVGLRHAAVWTRAHHPSVRCRTIEGRTLDDADGCVVDASGSLLLAQNGCGWRHSGCQRSWLGRATIPSWPRGLLRWASRRVWRSSRDRLSRVASGASRRPGVQPRQRAIVRRLCCAVPGPSVGFPRRLTKRPSAVAGTKDMPHGSARDMPPHVAIPGSWPAAA